MPPYHWCLNATELAWDKIKGRIIKGQICLQILVRKKCSNGDDRNCGCNKIRRLKRGIATTFNVLNCTATFVNVL